MKKMLIVLLFSVVSQAANLSKNLDLTLVNATGGNSSCRMSFMPERSDFIAIPAVKANDLMPGDEERFILKFMPKTVQYAHITYLASCDNFDSGVIEISITSNSYWASISKDSNLVFINTPDSFVSPKYLQHDIKGRSSVGKIVVDQRVVRPL